MKFKVDENLPAEVADLLRNAGHDALTVFAQGHSGETDAFLAKICREENRSLVTLDLGFGNGRDYPPEAHPGIIVLRPDAPSKGSVMVLAMTLIEELRAASPIGALWVISEGRIRTRRGRGKLPPSSG